MKTSLLALVLVLALPGARAEELAASPLNLRETSAPAYWPSASVVNVYFVHDVFTSGEKQTLWGAIEAWAQAATKMGTEMRFVDAGETGGLIDCAGCLTITRQGFDINRFVERVSFNALRQDEAGHLTSAWIGFGRAPASPQALRTLMHQALRRGFEVGIAQSETRDRS